MRTVNTSCVIMHTKNNRLIFDAGDLIIDKHDDEVIVVLFAHDLSFSEYYVSTSKSCMTLYYLENNVKNNRFKFIDTCNNAN